MDSKEFLKNIEKFNKSENTFGKTFTPLFILSLLGLWYLFHKNPSNLFDNNVVSIISLILLFVYVIGNLVFQFKRVYKKLKKLNLYCPECKTYFFPNVFSLIVETKECTNCNNIIIDE